jgi:hypothetical protein
MRNCESCAYNQEIQENGWYENKCTHPDHPGIKSAWVFLNGCSNWKGEKYPDKTMKTYISQGFTETE